MSLAASSPRSARDVCRTEARIGQRVMVHHYQGCTQCEHCRSGWQQLCQQVPVKVYGYNAHGGHAQYLKVPANTLVPLARRIVVLRGRGDRLRLGHRLRRAAADEYFRQATPSRSSARARSDSPPRNSPRRWAPGDRARHQPPAAGARQGLRRRRGRRSRLQRSGRRDQGTDQGRYADLTLDTSSNPEARLNAIRSTKVWGTMCFVGEGGDVHIDVSRICCAGNDAGGVVDVFQYHPGRLRAVLVERKVDVDKLFTHRWSSTRPTRPINCSTSSRTAKAFS